MSVSPYIMDMNYHFRIAVTVAVVSMSAFIVTCVSGEIYCVTPDDMCPEMCSHCDTLSEYATKPDNFFASTTSLVLLNGDHILDRMLSIANIEMLYIYPNSSESPLDATVTCTPSGKFDFESIDHVTVSKLNFINCEDNELDSVRDAVIEDCKFHGGGRIGSGISLYYVTSAEILRSSFTFYNGNPAVYLKSTLSLVSIRPRLHDDNQTTNDFVINPGPLIVLKACTFSYNSAHSVEIFTATVHIHDSYFINTAQSAIKVSDYSHVAMNNCTFTNNTADSAGGAVGGSGINGSVMINNSNFIGNSVHTGVGGAVYIVELVNGFIIVNNSVFIGNEAAVAGGIRTEHGEVTIQNSVFINNTAIGGCSAIDIKRSTNAVIKNCTFIGNTVTGGSTISTGGAVCVGGGLDLQLAACLFISNAANTGGAIYITSTLTTVFDEDVTFMNNTGINGGAIFLEQTDLITYGSLYVQNNSAVSCVFNAVNSSLTVPLNSNWIITDNTGCLYTFSSNIKIEGYLELNGNSFGSISSTVGGAITMYQSEVVFTGVVNIVQNSGLNGGGILATESTLYFVGQVTIYDNEALQSGGGIYAYQSELNFREQTNVIENEASENGGGIHVVSSTIKVVEGFLHVVDNVAQRGGGTSLQLNSKFYITKLSDKNPQPKLVFENNSAKYGGALYIFDDTAGGCARDNANVVANECFFQTLALYPRSIYGTPNPQLTNAFFNSNTATETGSTLYGGLLDRCRVSPFAEFFYKYEELNSTTFTDSISYLANITNIPLQDIQTAISSSPVRVCFCNQDKQDCGYVPPPLKVTKGKMFKITLVAVDQVNNSVEATVHGSLATTDGGYIETQASYNISSTCTEVEYSTLSPHDSETLVLYAEGPCKDIGLSSTQIRLEYKPCPIGFKDVGIECDCDDELYPNYIVSCSINEETVLRKGNAWFMYENTTDFQGYTLHQYCPYSYCQPSSEDVHVNLNIPVGSDELCISNRSGKLCGSCEDGLSLVFGSSRCKQCSNHWITLTVVFALAGVVLVAFLLLLDLTVAHGTLYGLIFYANIFAANRNIFLPSYEPNVLTVFISWINLDFGFETCFFDGMDGYSKTWLQFAFPLYIFLLIIGVIEACRFSTITNFLARRNRVQMLATLIYLSYAKLLRTIIAALSVTVLEYSDGSQEVVWLYDANVLYCRGKHIPLFLAAVVVAIAGLFYTILLFSWQWMQRHSDIPCLKWTTNDKLKAYMDAFKNHYNDCHRYWIGLLPLLCVLLYLVFAANVFGDPRTNLLSINSVVVGLFFYQLVVASYGKEGEKTIYKEWFRNVLENSFFLNLIFLASVMYYITTDLEIQSQKAVTYTSITIAFLTFIGILVYHSWKVAPYSVKRRLKQVWNKVHKASNDRIKSNDDPRKTNQVEHGNHPSDADLEPNETSIDCEDCIQLMSSSEETVTSPRLSQGGNTRYHHQSYGSLRVCDVDDMQQITSTA